MREKSCLEVVALYQRGYQLVWGGNTKMIM
jgi:hypothetical protein